MPNQKCEKEHGFAALDKETNQLFEKGKVKGSPCRLAAFPLIKSLKNGRAR
ncbi:hypothetical protein JOD45_001036 [Scopulibacillus daqui]|uniref:Uncharacterized protein n=2 Tax=Scopulibacillus daqui TaxID=1469162 RepID=A0ABS2PXR3_9BACL|nr:hypothetical protein [Scopulibacillus daqui]